MHRASRGGRRTGAGAPAGNLNHLKHGQRSKIMKLAVSRLAADRELRAFLILIARSSVDGQLPASTRRLIADALQSPSQRTARLLAKVRHTHA
jgi:hypothetical protein